MRIALILLMIGLCGGTAEAMNIKGIVIHHSHTEQGTVESFRRYHTEEMGWVDIAYHFVIYRDGSIHKGRGVDKQGLHGDKRNWTHLGICLVGDNDFTDEQREALKSLCDKLARQYDIEAIERHRAVDNPCPGSNLDVEKLEQDILERGK